MLPTIEDHWDFSDPAASQVAFETLLKENADAPQGWRLEVMTQIARTWSLRRDFIQAHAVLDQIEAEVTEVSKVRYLLERGRSFNSAQRKEEAKPLFEQSMTLAQKYGQDHLAVDAAHMVAITVSGQEALEWNQKALAMAQAST